MFLFHEKQLKDGNFEFDEQGNLLLRPLGDWQVDDSGIKSFNEIDPARRLKQEPFVKGDPEAKFHRRTIHFGINGPVAPVENFGGLAGGRVVEDAHAVMFRLDDLPDLNQSLDNLLPYDTFLTPAPGQPLVIPKGKFKVLKREAGKDWTMDGVETTLEDVAESMGADREKFIAQRGKRRGDLEEKVYGISDGLARVAYGKYGVGAIEHSSSMQSSIDKADFKYLFGNDDEQIKSASQIVKASQNWITSFYDIGLPLGASRGEARTNINKELADKLGITITRQIAV